MRRRGLSIVPGEGSGEISDLPLCSQGPAPCHQPDHAVVEPQVAPAPSAFVYLLRCRDGSLYCGWTSDLERRVRAHRAGTASRYTRSRLPVELIWARPMGSRSEAMREEARIKALSRAQKIRLAAGP